MGVTGTEYRSPNHRPRSIRWQRSLQNGIDFDCAGSNHSSHVGQRMTGLTTYFLSFDFAAGFDSVLAADFVSDLVSLFDSDDELDSVDFESALAAFL